MIFTRLCSRELFPPQALLSTSRHSGASVFALSVGARGLWTQFEYAGVEPLLGTQHGQGLHPVIEGDASRDCALNEWEILPARAGVALGLRTVRTKTHKLTVHWRSGAGEVHDLTSDPEEASNFFNVPEVAGVRRELETLLDRPQDDVGPICAPVGIA